jgi:hypothetical protein
MCDNELCESSNLYCKTHTSSAFYDKRSLEIMNKESFEISDFIFDGKLNTHNCTKPTLRSMDDGIPKQV